jgi:hypothetical protein
MASPTGGRWVFSITAQPVVLGINNGVAPVFPQPQAGAFNIEVFTNPAVDALVDSKIDRPDAFGNPTPIFVLAPVPPPEPGFQSSMADAGGALENGFLTGASLRLTNGDFLAVDSVTGAATQSPSQITLGSGKQTVVGAKGDTLVGGAGNQILSALLGSETVIGGSGNESIWGGANDSIMAIVGGSGTSQQIVVTGTGTTLRIGTAGGATISAAAQDTILSSVPANASPPFQTNIAIAAGQNDLIDLTSINGVAAVIGAAGDTISGAGGGITNIEGAAGGMLIKAGNGSLGSTTALSGSAGAVAGNTVSGGSGGFDFNPSSVAGKGDLLDLSGSNGTATINAFAFQSTRVASPDTILATNNADSVFGGGGDRVGTGNGSVVGGLHQWVHADTLAGSAVGFGSNDTVSSVTYDTASHTAAPGTVAGTSSAQVTVGGFATATDFIFYQNESDATTSAIIATSQGTIIGGAPSAIITLPDGTVMTLVGVTQAQLAPALFKP